MTRTRPWPLTAAFAAISMIVGLAACNALVGNGDIQLTDDGGIDATTLAEASVEAATPSSDGPGAEAGPDAPLSPDAPPDGTAGPLECDAGAKICAGACVALDDAVFGCGPNRCAACELPNAYAGCGLVPGTTDGGVVDSGTARDAGDAAGDAGNAPDQSCTVALCKTGHADCNHEPLDGCEVDTSADLYNCGSCGHDCSNLPHVAGNVSCVGGACSFDQTACAPGYGICSGNPDDGCNTNISAPSHCGGCATTCDPGHPYCSPTGAASSFACTSGCASGLSLCGASCVDETTDPNNCGGCMVQCPAVAGGVPTCSPGGVCGFACIANDHLCSPRTVGSCAANNDPSHCGVGNACGSCVAPANAFPTCTGGVTCGYACDPNAHACGPACALDDDPNNCGVMCGTNCPGPTAGTATGVASCDGNACSITCSRGAILCGAACVAAQADVANCGACGHGCGAGQACQAGQCVCNPSSCTNGCCDANAVCQPLACGTGGAACAVGCPATIPEASNLVLWLVGDTFVPGASTWFDQSGRHADANCSGSACPPSVSVPAIGHRAVSFAGASSFALGDPGMQYSSAAWTVFVVASPDPGAAPNAQLLVFADGVGDSIGLQRSGSANDLLFQILPGSTPNSLVGTGAWAGSWERLAANVDPVGASLTLGSGAPITGAVGAPAAVDHPASYLGTDPSQSLNYAGLVAEVLVYASDLSPASVANVEAYLASRYGLQ